MSATRTSIHRLPELGRLHSAGVRSRRMAPLQAVRRYTARQYREALAWAGLLDGPAAPWPEEDLLVSALQATMPTCPPRQEVATVDARAVDTGHPLHPGQAPRAIYAWLRAERLGFTRIYDAVGRQAPWMRQKQPAQVDFNSLGSLLDPSTVKQRKACRFGLDLGVGGHMYAELAFDQRSETWQRLDAAAFMALGGVPAVLVPDTLKAAVIRADFTSSDEGTPDLGCIRRAAPVGGGDDRAAGARLAPPAAEGAPR